MYKFIEWEFHCNIFISLAFHTTKNIICGTCIRLVCVCVFVCMLTESQNIFYIAIMCIFLVIIIIIHFVVFYVLHGPQMNK